MLHVCAREGMQKGGRMYCCFLRFTHADTPYAAIKFVRTKHSLSGWIFVCRTSHSVNMEAAYGMREFQVLNCFICFPLRAWGGMAENECNIKLYFGDVVSLPEASSPKLLSTEPWEQPKWQDAGKWRWLCVGCQTRCSVYASLRIFRPFVCVW